MYFGANQYDAEYQLRPDELIVSCLSDYADRSYVVEYLEAFGWPLPDGTTCQDLNRAIRPDTPRVVDFQTLSLWSRFFYQFIWLSLFVADDHDRLSLVVFDQGVVEVTLRESEEVWRAYRYLESKGLTVFLIVERRSEDYPSITGLKKH